MPRVRTVVRGEELVHKRIWAVAERHVKRAVTAEPGSSYDDLVAMVFGSLALEGYVNCLGERIAPEIWKNERQRFRSTGLSGKLTTLYQVLNVLEPDKKQRQYATVWILKDFRNLIAHSKPRRFEEAVERDIDDRQDLFPHGFLFDDYVSHVKACNALEDIEAVITAIHQAAFDRLSDDDAWFKYEPLRGSFASGEGTTSVI